MSEDDEAALRITPNELKVVYRRFNFKAEYFNTLYNSTCESPRLQNAMQTIIFFSFENFRLQHEYFPRQFRILLTGRRTSSAGVIVFFFFQRAKTEQRPGELFTIQRPQSKSLAVEYWGKGERNNAVVQKKKRKNDWKNFPWAVSLLHRFALSIEIKT